MSRSRNVKPGLFRNEDLSECQPLARLLFIGLWCEADREGRLEDRPKRLKAEVLPYDNCDVEVLLNELCKYKFILRYVSDGVKFIQVVNFSKHQNPHIKEAESTIPAPDLHHIFTDHAVTEEPCKSGASTVQAPTYTGTSPADSLLLIPDSLKTTIPPKVEGEGFAEFYAAYPRKCGRQDAAKAWAKLRPDTELRAKMKSAVAQWSASEQWRKDGGKFIPMPATWINGRRWEDALNGASYSANRGGSIHSGLNEIDYTAGLGKNGRPV